MDRRKITTLEVFILSTVFVFLAGLVTELINWLTGNSFWEYKVAEWKIMFFDMVVFGTVHIGVLFGWIFVGVIVGLLVSFIAKRVEWE